MSDRKLIAEVPEIGATGGAYSPAVVVGDFCFVSGQIALDKGGKLVSGDIESQTAVALSNLLGIVAAAGFSADEVCQVTVILADINDWAAMDRVYRSVMQPHGFPARMAFAGGLPPGALVEIQGVAARSPRSRREDP